MVGEWERFVPRVVLVGVLSAERAGTGFTLGGGVRGDRVSAPVLRRGVVGCVARDAAVCNASASSNADANIASRSLIRCAAWLSMWAVSGALLVCMLGAGLFCLLVSSPGCCFSSECFSAGVFFDWLYWSCSSCM